jgi:hypothetical protein
MEAMESFLQRTLSREKLSRDHALDTAMGSEKGGLKCVVTCGLGAHVFAVLFVGVP